MDKKKEKPIMTLKDALKPEDLEMDEEFEQWIKEHNVKTVSMTELLEGDEEIPYVTMDNISAIMEQLETEEDKKTVVLRHRSADGKKSQWRSKVFVTGAIPDLLAHFDDIADRFIDKMDCDVYCYDKPLNLMRYGQFELYLSQMNYMVLLVSPQLFVPDSSTMDEKQRADRDWHIATDYGIPVLPVLLDDSAIADYNKEIGHFELLDIHSPDFSTKLSNFISAQEASGELISRVQSAFPRRVFLSYRKKDSEEANMLLDALREDPELCDVQVWYDDYLTPGENYNEEIRGAIENADAVLLLVTENILEEGNYVKNIEYPMARNHERGIPVIPVYTYRLKKCTLSKVREAYPDMPTAIPLEEAVAVIKSALPATKALTDTEQYLIGLSYMYGIASERDPVVAVSYLFPSAASGNIHAIGKLWAMTAVWGNFRKTVTYAAMIEEDMEPSCDKLLNRTQELMGYSEEAIKRYTPELEGGDYTNLKEVYDIATTLQTQYILQRNMADASRISDFLLQYVDRISIRKVERHEALARIYFRLASMVLYRDNEQAVQHIQKAIRILDEINNDKYAGFPRELYINVHCMAMQAYRVMRRDDDAIQEGWLLEDYTDDITPDSDHKDRCSFIAFASAYLQLLTNPIPIEEFVARANPIVQSVEPSAQTATLLMGYYGALGQAQHEVLKDNQATLDTFLIAYPIAKNQLDFTLQGATSFFALCKTCIDIASVYSELDQPRESEKYYLEALDICRNVESFHNKYTLYSQCIGRYAKLLVLSLENPEGAVECYQELLTYIFTNRIREGNVLFDIPDTQFRIGYLASCMGDEEGATAYYQNAKAFIEKVMETYGDNAPRDLIPLYSRILRELNE